MIEGAAFGCVGVLFHEAIRVYRKVTEGYLPIRRELAPWYAISVVVLLLIGATTSYYLSGGNFIQGVLLGWLVPSGANAVFGSKGSRLWNAGRQTRVEHGDKDASDKSELPDGNLDVTNGSDGSKLGEVLETEDDALQQESGFLRRWADNFFWY